MTRGLRVNCLKHLAGQNGEAPAVLGEVRVEIEERALPPGRLVGGLA